MTRTPYAFAAMLAALSLMLTATGCGTRRPPAPPAPTAASLYSDGVNAYRAGDNERTVKLLTEAVRRNPNLAMAHSILGDIYKASGDYDNAATQYESLTKIDPYAADNHHRLAVSYHFLNRLRDAAAAYLRAIKLNPRDWRSCMNLGLVYMALGDNNAAVEYCQRAANLSPLEPVAHANLGVALDARGNVAEAEAAYRKSLTIDPRQSGPAMNLARNLQYRNRTDEAVAVLKSLTEAADSPSVRRRYGDALAAAGRDADALREYRQSLTLDPRHYPAMNATAALLITQYRKGLLLDDRKRDEAVAMWKQSLQINPDQPKVETQVKNVGAEGWLGYRVQGSGFRLEKRDALDILAQTDDWVAVIKPTGLATIPGRAEDDCVLERLGRQLGLPSSGTADPRVRIVHRLDKDTSGVLLFAKNSTAQRHISRQFQYNTVRKEYLAVVAGRPSQAEGEVDAPLARHPSSSQRMAIVRHGGRPARTAWRVEESFREFTLLRVFPRTGKTHQIRVHLQSIGLPLAIDPLYSAPRSSGRASPGLMLSAFKRGYRPTAGVTERPLIDRLTLHAEKLGFHDLSGANVEITAPLPKDLRAALNMLRKYGR